MANVVIAMYRLGRYNYDNRILLLEINPHLVSLHAKHQQMLVERIRYFLICDLLYKQA